MKHVLAILAVMGALVVFSIGCTTSNTKVEPAKINKPVNGTNRKVPESIKKALSNGKPTILFFFGKWDATSSQVKPFIESANKEFGSKINLFKMDVDDKNSAYLMAKFNIGYLPDTIIIDSTGKTVMHLDGWIDYKTIQSGIEDALTGGGQE